MNKLLIVLLLVLPGTPALAQVQIPQAPLGPLGPPQARAPSGPPSLPPGLYVQVVDGAIHLSNSGGSQNFSAGQFGYTPGVTQPPVMVPRNPGIQFTPPPVFNSGSGNPTPPTGSKSGSVDCEVR